MEDYTKQDEAYRAYKKGFEAGVKSVTDNNVGGKMKPIDKDTNVPSKWIPVTERLPTEEDANENESVLAIEKTDGFGRSWIWDVVVRYSSQFTHWMPFPKPPKGE